MNGVNPNQSKYNYMLENNKKYMDLVALSFGERKITYEQMHDRINKYSKMLYSKGVRQGNIIGVCALNTPESVYLLYALDMIGAIVVGFNPLESKEKIKRDIELTKPKMIITVDMNYSNFKDYEKALNFSTIMYPLMESMDNKKIKIGYNILQALKGNFTLNKDKKMISLLKNTSNEILVPKASFKSSSLTDIMFTGGSTGIHKGVDLAGEGLNYVVAGLVDTFNAKPGMVELGHIPFGHMAFGRMILHYTLCNNMEFALTLKAMPEDFYDELVRTHANGAVGGPPHWMSLIEKRGDQFVPSSKISPGSLSCLEYATSGGESLKQNAITAINESLAYAGSTTRVGDGLGATETWASIIVNNGKTHLPNTLGTPIRDLKIKLINPETGKIVSKGERGIAYISGPCVMIGYHNNDEESKKVISYDSNGEKWFNIGDYLCECENGEYIYVGRQKRNFVCGVTNIYPEEIEEVLISIPEIKEAVVTPIADDMLQFVPRYHISLVSENVDYSLLEEKINAIVEKKVGKSALPMFIKYYNKPLKRMDNSKIDVGYYKREDIEDLKNGKMDIKKLVK